MKYILPGLLSSIPRRIQVEFIAINPRISVLVQEDPPSRKRRDRPWPFRFLRHGPRGYVPCLVSGDPYSLYRSFALWVCRRFCDFDK